MLAHSLFPTQQHAIYNNATLTFEGNATFSGNMADDELNDILNDGVINVNGDTLSLEVQAI